MKPKIQSIEQINTSIKTNKQEFIEECENNFKNQVESVVEVIKQNPSKKFVMIAGPSSSGKTTTSVILQYKLQNLGYEAIVVSLDDYFYEKDKTPRWEDGEYNFETSESIDWDIFEKCMKGLLNGEEVHLPTFNFTTGCREFSGTTKIKDNSIVIIEGLHALNPIIDKYIDDSKKLKVYISANTDLTLDGEHYIAYKNVRLFRRIIRDLYKRATCIEETIKMWQKVILGERLYIDPFIDTAEITINSFHGYEISVYKDLFNMLKETSPELNSICLTLEPFESIQKDLVPADSVLQEFIPND